jgi:hypothetical protein
MYNQSGPCATVIVPWLPCEQCQPPLAMSCSFPKQTGADQPTFTLLVLDHSLMQQCIPPCSLYYHTAFIGADGATDVHAADARLTCAAAGC